MIEENGKDDSIKLSKDEREFYDSIKYIFDEKISWNKAHEKILRPLFQEIHDYYDEQLEKGLTRKEIYYKLKPMYRGTPRNIADKVSNIIITGLIEDAPRK